MVQNLDHFPWNTPVDPVLTTGGSKTRGKTRGKRIKTREIFGSLVQIEEIK